jgi:hypothetical protein
MPAREGFSDAYQLYKDTDKGDSVSPLRSGLPMRDLSRDYVFFTYAPLCLYGGLTHNPVQEWINIHNVPPCVHICKLPRPILRTNLLDLSTRTVWDRTVWAVERPRWPSLLGHLGAMALVDRGRHAYTRVLVQDIPVVDVLRQDAAVLTELPFVNITAFSIDSNKATIAFRVLPAEKCQDPYLDIWPAEPVTVRLADAVLRMAENPYEDVQPFPWEKEL